MPAPLTPRISAIVPRPSPPVSSHAHFEALTRLPSCVEAFSLRSTAQIERYRKSTKLPPMVTYDPAGDTDPRRQDAAKVVVEGPSLTTQVHLPLSHDPARSFVVTWDAWFGAEWAFAKTGIGNYKTFNICSPSDAIWFEINNDWQKGAKRGVLAALECRNYPRNGLGPNVLGKQPLLPQLADFDILAETWIRYVVRFDAPDPDGYNPVWLWALEPATGPVRLYDGLQVRPDPAGIGKFRVEYNTSFSGPVLTPGPRVSYVRNLTAHVGVEDMGPFLERPAAA